MDFVTLLTFGDITSDFKLGVFGIDLSGDSAFENPDRDFCTDCDAGFLAVFGPHVGFAAGLFRF